MNLENELLDALSLIKKPLAAKRLAEEIKTKERLFATSRDTLAEISGDEGAARLLSLAAALSARRICDGFRFGISHTDAEICDFIVASFRGIPVEVVCIMLFDKQMRPISYELVNEGTANYSDVVPIKLLERATRKGALAAIIAHNHPAGDPAPSAEDFTSTLIIKDLFDKAGIKLLYHLVVSGNKAARITPEMLSLRIEQ